MDESTNNYLPGDQRLIEQIVRELKSQGIFDQFRRECISDVDTKPAYQNLRQRVESSVSSFLSKQTWSSEMNKNQVREMLRKNIYECGFLETGVERIVDQVVNPKITSVFLPKVEDIVYKFLGMKKPTKIETDTLDYVELNTFHDLLPKDLEAISPDVSDEKDGAETPTDCLPVEEVESPPYEIFSEKDVKISQRENSRESHSSDISDHISQDSNHSMRHESLPFSNCSEGILITNSDTTCSKESQEVSIEQTINTSRGDRISNENVETELNDQKTRNESIETNTSDKNYVLDEGKKISSLEGPQSKSQHFKKRNDEEKKRGRPLSPSNKNKSKSRDDKSKDKSRSEKHNKEGREQKVEKEKYRIPKISEKSESEKESKLKERESTDKSKCEKDYKTEKEEKNEKSDKYERKHKHKNRKHSSERERLKYDKSRKDGRSDKNHKDRNEDKRRKETKDDKNRDGKLKEDKLKNDRITENRKNDKKKSEKLKEDSSSSKSKEISFIKDKAHEKDCRYKKSKIEVIDKNNGDNDLSSSKRDSLKNKKDEDKSKILYRKSEKQEKNDKKRKRTPKDDHHSSKDKKNERRSSDRDSDGPSNNRRVPFPPGKNGEGSSSKTLQDPSSSNVEKGAEDSCSPNKHKEVSVDHEDKKCLLILLQKIRLPKLASNMQEAMKIIKIRKQLKRLETMNELNIDNHEMKKLLRDITDLSKDVIEEEVDKRQNDDFEVQISPKETLNINDFISSSNISMAKWNALEAKFMKELGSIDYNSYESPYVDEEMNIGNVHEKSLEIEMKTKSDGLENNSSAETEVSVNIKMDKQARQYKTELYAENTALIYNDSIEEEHKMLEVSEVKKIHQLSEDDQGTYSSMAKINVSTKESSKNNEDEFNHNCEVETISNFDLDLDENLQCSGDSSNSTNKYCDVKQVSNPLSDKNCRNKEKFTKKAIVLLKKHDLAEQMIKMKNGECDYLDILLREKLETEADTQLEDTLRENDKQNLEEYLDKIECIKLKNSETTIECKSEYESEKGFLGFETHSGDKERNITILRCLLKCFKESINEDKKYEDKKHSASVKKRIFRGRKRKIEEKCETDSKNDTVTKKKRPNFVSCNRSKNSATSLTKKNLIANNKFSIPLSPAEIEHEDKKSDVQSTNVTLNVRSRVCNNNAKQYKAVRIFSSSDKSEKLAVELKNVQKQRYTNEDLYKPRMFLRRTNKKP